MVSTVSLNELATNKVVLALGHVEPSGCIVLVGGHPVHVLVNIGVVVENHCWSGLKRGLACSFDEGKSAVVVALLVEPVLGSLWSHEPSF